MSIVPSYLNNLRIVDHVIQSKTEGLNHEDSMRQLPFPGNCMNWNLGHILVYRMEILGAIDGVTKADPGEFALYGYGSEPLTDSAKAIPLETLLSRLEDASQRVSAALEAMPASRLEEMLDPERGVRVQDRLTFYIMFHEAYHVGQLEPLRELALAHKS